MNAVRAMNTGHPDVAARLMHEGLALLGWRQPADGGTDDLPVEHQEPAARLLRSLSLVEAELGHARYGLRLLDSAQRLSATADHDRGVLLMQRGTILMRTGRWQEALAQLTAAEPLLEADPYQLAGVLMNRGVLYLSTGNVRRARGDFVKGRTIAGEANLELQVAKATHNLGYCELLGGDVPSALNLFGAAASVYRRIAPGLMPALETDRARALLAVGLADEAAGELDSAIEVFRRRRSDQDCAEAELDRAQAALAAGDAQTARRWSAAAIRRFRARGNDAWAALAELTRLRAAAASRARGYSAAARRRGTAASRPAPRPSAPRGRGPRRADRGPRAHRCGPPDDAVRGLDRAGGRGLPLDVTLLRRLTRAELGAGHGRRARAGHPRRVRAGHGHRGRRRGGRPPGSRAGLRSPAPPPPSRNCGPGCGHYTKGAASSGPSTCSQGRPRSAPSSLTWGCALSSSEEPPGRCSPGWSCHARRHSGSGRCARPRIPTRPRSSPSFASSAC